MMNFKLEECVLDSGTCFCCRARVQFERLNAFREVRERNSYAVETERLNEPTCCLNHKLTIACTRFEQPRS